MNFSVGVDIVLNQRISNLLNKYGNHFLDRIYTQEELKYCMTKKEPVPYLSSRFCAKEAFIKALGTNESFCFKDIEVYGLGLKKKNIKIYNKVKKKFDQSGFNTIVFSMSHENLYSVAIVSIY